MKSKEYKYLYFLLISFLTLDLTIGVIIPCDVPFFDCDCRLLERPGTTATRFSQFCPLAWTFMSSGDQLITKGIQSEPGSPLFAIRVLRDQNYHVGSYDIVKRQAYFINSRNETDTADSFEVLTNPHNCTIHWQEYIVGSPNEHATDFGIFISDEVYMARFFDDENENWIPGALVITGNGISAFNYVYGPVRNVTYPQILQSYSAGLRLEVQDAVMAKENLFTVTSWDFMGVDEIRNDGSGVVELELSHFKQTVRHYGFAFNANISASVIVEISLSPFFSDRRIDILHCNLGADELPVIFRRTETVPMKVTRKVTIPPYAHIESCSIVKYVHNVNIDFTGRGKYKVRGWTGEQVKSLLANEGVIYDDVGSDYVALDVSGKISFSLALNTKFFIGSFNTAPCWNLGTRMGNLENIQNTDITKNLIVFPKEQ